MVKPRKAKPRLHEFNLTVKGLHYRLYENELQQIEERIEEGGGLPVKFELEPSNEVDPKAVKVIVLDPVERVFHNLHIGYVARPSNAALFSLIQKGVTFKLAMLTFLDPEDGEAEVQVAVMKEKS